VTLEQKAQLARELYEARARRDLGGVADCYHPDADFDFSRSRAPHSGVYRGHLEIRSGLEETLEPWMEWAAEPHDFVEIDDDRLLFSARARMTGRDGITLTVQSAHIWTFRDGQITRAVFFQSRQEAEVEAARTASAPGFELRDPRM
jgi:ketosteroid isomerase-like protein